MSGIDLIHYVLWANELLTIESKLFRHEPYKALEWIIKEAVIIAADVPNKHIQKKIQFI